MAHIGAQDRYGVWFLTWIEYSLINKIFKEVYLLTTMI